MANAGRSKKASSSPQTRQIRRVDPIRSKKELRAIRDKISRPRDLALFTLGINSGLRALDLLSLAWDDILDDDGSIKRRLCVRERRRRKERVIPLGPKVREALGEIVPDEDELVLEDYVFPGRGGKRMSIQRLHQLVNKWTEAAGLKGNFGTHTLRKTYAHYLLKQGADVRKVMATLGHSSPSVTLRYARMTQHSIDRMVLKLDL